MSRRISRKRTKKTYAGRVVYDRKPHRFVAKDVIRVAAKADYSEFDIEDLAALRNAIFSLLVNTYGVALGQTSYPIDIIGDLFIDLFGVLSGIYSKALQFQVDLWQLFIEFLLYNIPGIERTRIEGE